MSEFMALFFNKEAKPNQPKKTSLDITPGFGAAVPQSTKEYVPSTVITEKRDDGLYTYRVSPSGQRRLMVYSRTK